MTQKTTVLLFGGALSISLAANLLLYYQNINNRKDVQEIRIAPVPAAEPVKIEVPKSDKYTPGKLPVQLASARYSGDKIDLDFISSGNFIRDTAGVRIDPELDNLRFDLIGSKIRLYGDFRPGTKYRITVNAGLKNSTGSVLDENAVTEVKISDRSPEIAFVTRGEYLPLNSEKLVLPYRALNCSSVEVTVMKAYENNLNPFYGMDWRADQRMVTVAERTIALKDPKNESIFHELDLLEILGGRNPGVYKVDLYAPDLNRMCSQRFVLTDLALQAVDDNFAGQILVFCRSLSENKSVPGAAVTVLSYKNQVVATGVTGEDGSLQLQYDPAWNRQDDYPVGVIAKKDGDLSYFRLKDSRHLGNESAYDATEPRAFVFAERGACRPGESFTASVFLRQPENGTYIPMKNVPVTLKVNDPNSRLFTQMQLKTDEFGFAQAEIPVPATAMTGSYSIYAFAGGGKESCGYGRIAVAAYVPDRIKITGMCKTENPGIATPVDFEFDAKYYFGAPVELGSYKYEVDASFGPRPAHWDKSWNYGAPDFFKYGNTWSGKGAKGKDVITIQYPGFAQQGGHSFNPVLITARAEVQEPGGRGVSGLRSVTVYPTEFFIGLRDAEPENFKKSIEWTLLPAVKDRKIKAADAEITFELVRKEWEYALTMDSRDNYRRQWEQRRIPLPDRKITRPVPAATAIEKVAWDLPSGEYELTAKIGDLYCSQMNFYHYAGEGGSRSANPNTLYFNTNAEVYNPGEQVVFSFDSIGSGEAFLVLGEKKVENYRIVPVKAGKNEVTITLPTNIHSSSYFAGVTVVTKEKSAYVRNFGLLKVKIDQSKAHRLSVKLNLPETSEPEKEIPVTVTLSDAAGQPKSGVVCLYLVDSGVISLTNYTVPDIFNYFYGPIACGFEFYDMYGLIFEQLKITPDGRVGGDVAGKIAVLKQKDTARVMLPPVKVPASGTASVTVKLPDHVGAMDVFAVASCDDAAGAESASIIMRNKVTVTASAPRYIAPGDTAELSFTVFNHDAATSAYSCTVTLPESLEAVNNQSLTFSGNDLPKGSQKNLTLTVRAKEIFEAGVLKAALQVGGDSARTDTYVNVRAVNVAQTDYRLVILQPGEKTEFKLADNYVGKPDGKLRLSASPALGVASALDWLNGYPYGCLEQTVAAAFPFVALPALVKNGLVAQEVGNTVKHKVAIGYSRILQMALSDGSFAMWPGGSEPWHEASIFALHFVFEAIRQNMLSIDDASREKYLKYLRKIATDAEPWNRNKRAYAIYVLAIAGDNAFLTAARNMVSSSDKADYALFLAGAALVKGGYANIGTRPMTAALEMECYRVSNVPMPYSDDACRLGMALYILMDCNLKDDALATRLAVELAKSVRQDGSAWGTTQANAWASLGLAAYSNQFPPRPAQAEVNGEKFSIASLKESRMTQNATVTNTGSGILIAESIVSGIPRQSPPDGGKLKVSKVYLDRMGKQVTAVNHGDEVFVKIYFEAPFEIESIVIADLLPAGLEIEDESLATRAAMLPKNISARYGALYPKRLEKRDDRFLIFGDANTGKAEFVYRTRAVIRGTFAVPPLHAESMYQPDVKGVFGGIAKFTVK